MYRISAGGTTLQPALAYAARSKVATKLPTASRLVANGLPVGLETVSTSMTKFTRTVLAVNVVVPHVTLDERFSVQANSLFPRYEMRVVDLPRSVMRTRSVWQLAPLHGCSKRHMRLFEAPTLYAGPRKPVVSLLDNTRVVMSHMPLITGTFSARGAELAVTALMRAAQTMTTPQARRTQRLYRPRVRRCQREVTEAVALGPGSRPSEGVTVHATRLPAPARPLRRTSESAALVTSRTRRPSTVHT